GGLASIPLSGRHQRGPSPTGTPANSAAAIFTASMILTYPVQRQTLPDRASRISASLGRGFSSSRALEVIRKPGVQKPHWLPPVVAHAFCKGWSAAPHLRPSTVVIFVPTASSASIRQES